MQRKHRWRLLLLLFLVFGGLFITRSLWQPWLFGLILPRQQKLEGIKLILDTLNGLATLLPAIFAIYLFFTKGSPDKNVDKTKLLTQTSPEKILDEYVSEKAAEITWLDRDIVNPNDLRLYPKIILVGPMKSGKSREAAELIRKALHDGTLIPSRVYDITTGIKAFPSDTIQVELERELDRGSRVLYYVNDLPKQSTGKQIDTLTAYLKAVHKCSPGYFLGTARSDHLIDQPELMKWLAKNEFKLIQMKPLDHEKRGQLIDELSVKQGINLIQNARAILLERSDGTPNQLIWIFKTLASEDKHEIDEALASEFISKSAAQIWNDKRNELREREPAVDSLITASTVFYHANVNPHKEIVTAYAAALYRQGRKWIPTWLAQYHVKRAVKLLEPHEIYSTSFNISDIALDPRISSEAGMTRLEEFIRSYRRIYRRPFLWKFNSQAGAQQEISHDLAISLYLTNEIEKAQEILGLVLSADPQDAQAWYKLGVLLKEQGRPEEAEQAYRQAVAADRQNARAWSNLGVLLQAQGQLEEAEQAYRQAVAADPQLAQAYREAVTADPQDAKAWSNLGTLYRMQNMLEDARQALEQTTRLKPEKAFNHASLGAVYRKLGLNELATPSFAKAKEQSDNEAIYNRACIAALCGDDADAILLLAEAISSGEITKEWIRKDPDWEDYRNDPRYKELVGDD